MPATSGSSNRKNMKYIFLSLSLLFSITCFAKDNNKDFIKLIQKYDVPEKARNLDPDVSTTQFWNQVLDDNPINLNLIKNINKGKGAEKEALAGVNRMKLYDYRLDVTLIPELKGYCDTLMMNMGLPKGVCEVNVIHDPSPNAFAVLTQNGFAICLNTGLLKRLDYDYYRIMAVTAHEFAHGAFFHHLRTEYETAKKERKDKVAGAIAAGLTAISAGVDAYTSAATGSNTYDPSFYSDRINDIADEMKLSSIKFRYKYNREEELQADLVALRFMEHLGMGKKYMEALQMISSSKDYFWYDEEFSNHPSTIYRLEFLDFVLKNPQYGFGVKPKEEKKIDKNADPLYD